MQAIVLSEGRYLQQDVARPVPQNGQVLIRVAYAGVNRADLFQKQGRYPLPENAPAIPGLEVAGEVTALGEGVASFALGDKVCSLLGEGAFAEYVCTPATQILPVPASIGVDLAAALPEACFTAWVALMQKARMKPGESVLIHGGAGGIGHMAIQIAATLGARVFATAGTDEKCTACKQLGAEAINYQREDFVSVIQQATKGRGVDIILDAVGGDYLPRNLACLAPHGRLCIIAFLKGSRTDANLSPILLKSLQVTGFTLRALLPSEKAAITTELQQHIWPLIGAKDGIKPLIAQIFPLGEAEKALEHMHQGLNVGKILLKI